MTFDLRIATHYIFAFLAQKLTRDLVTEQPIEPNDGGLHRPWLVLIRRLRSLLERLLCVVDGRRFNSLDLLAFILLYLNVLLQHDRTRNEWIWFTLLVVRAKHGIHANNRRLLRVVARQVGVRKLLARVVSFNSIPA